MARITKKISRKTKALRIRLWPELDEEDLWSRSVYDGFTTIPRTMPLIMNIIDDIADGKRTSLTYLALWGKAFDEMYISLANPNELAFHSGFTGQRAVRTWRARMKALEELGFIKVASGVSGDLSHAVILNPHFAIRRLYEAKTPGLTQAAYNTLVERAFAISAEDMEVELPEDREEESSEEESAEG